MPLTALYDGHCVICTSSRRFVRALDWFNRVEFLDLHDTDVVHARYPQLDFAALMGEMHVVEPGHAPRAGYAAIRRMLRELPLGLPLWVILLLPGMNWLGNRVYRFVARHRYMINRWFGVEVPECVDGVCKIPQ